MAQHDRNLLKRADIERFQKWLDGNEWRVGKGEYQLMQVKLAKGWGAICFDASGAVTTPPEIAPLIKQFKSGKPRTAPPVQPAAVINISEEQHIEDLRDDFAMAALQGIMVSTSTQDAKRELMIESQKAGASLPDYIADISYRMADAMLAARKPRN